MQFRSPKLPKTDKIKNFKNYFEKDGSCGHIGTAFVQIRPFLTVLHSAHHGGNLVAKPALGKVKDKDFSQK